MLGAFVPVALKQPAAHAAGIAAALKTARLLAAVAANSEALPGAGRRQRHGARADPHGGARLPARWGLSAAEWSVFAAGANRLARAVLEETGLRTVFHHHCAGYVETPDEIAGSSN